MRGAAAAREAPRAEQQRPPRQLGSVVFLDPQRGQHKRGTVMAQGGVWGGGTHYESTLSWLEEAPFERGEAWSARETAREAVQAMQPAARGERAAVLGEQVGDAAEPAEGAAQGRRRSRSVQGPSPCGDGENVLLLETLEVARLGQRLGEACRALFGKWCAHMSLFSGNPADLAADGVVRSVGADLEESNRNRESWDAALARAGGRLAVCCEAYMAEHGLEALPPGAVVLTPAFDLPSRFILHVAAPAGAGELRHLYRRVLERSEAEGFSSLILTLLGDSGACDVAETARELVAVLAERQGDSLWGLERLVLACSAESELGALREAVLAAGAGKKT